MGTLATQTRSAREHRHKLDFLYQIEQLLWAWEKTNSLAEHGTLILASVSKADTRLAKIRPVYKQGRIDHKFLSVEIGDKLAVTVPRNFAIDALFEGGFVQRFSK